VKNRRKLLPKLPSRNPQSSKLLARVEEEMIQLVAWMPQSDAEVAGGGAPKKPLLLLWE
jgi:hypothetical protein